MSDPSPPSNETPQLQALTSPRSPSHQRPAIHIDIPPTLPFISGSHDAQDVLASGAAALAHIHADWTPGHSHVNIAHLPSGHSHINLDVGLAALFAPSPATPHGSPSPATPKGPRPSARTTRRGSLFFVAHGAHEGGRPSRAQTLDGAHFRVNFSAAGSGARHDFGPARVESGDRPQAGAAHLEDDSDTASQASDSDDTESQFGHA